MCECFIMQRMKKLNNTLYFASCMYFLYTYNHIFTNYNSQQFF